VLLGHPAVADAAVFGAPCTGGAGELPMACVVRQPSACVTELQLAQFVQDRVAPFKRLRGGVKFVDVIPKTASGKILRRMMKEQLLKGKLWISAKPSNFHFIINTLLRYIFYQDTETTKLKRTSRELETDSIRKNSIKNLNFADKIMQTSKLMTAADEET